MAGPLIDEGGNRGDERGATAASGRSDGPSGARIRGEWPTRTADAAALVDAMATLDANLVARISHQRETGGEGILRWNG